ncbi:MAG: FAD-dependent oxidoreductase [Planctomycetota bacterium]|nr:FAD-dependent oxidoreductase [Planctomycetota bacterium]
MSQPRIVVIGAGIVGAACARSLARRGGRVELLEAGDGPGLHGATAAGMGHIVVNDGDPEGLQLCKLGRELWRSDSPPMSTADGFIEVGTLWMAEEDDDLENLSEAAGRLSSAGVEARILQGEELFEAEPALARDLAGGLQLPQDGVLYAPVAAAALVEDACRQGATLRCRTRVSEVKDNHVILDSGEKVEADFIVIASGLDALELCPGSESCVPIHPREGHLAITARGTCVVSHHVVEAGYQKGAHGEVDEAVACAVLPRSTDQLCIGSSRRQRRAGKIDSELMEKIIRRAERFIPGVSALPVIRNWTGTRAASADGRPLIGPLPGSPSIQIAAGFEGLGITQAPAAAELISASIFAEDPPLDPTPWHPARN